MNAQNQTPYPDQHDEIDNEEFDEFGDIEDDESELVVDDEYHESADPEDEDDENDGDDSPAPTRSPAPASRGLRSLKVAAEEEEELPPSKTKIKKQMHELQDLGEELVGLGKDQLAQLDLPETLYLAIREMARINKFGARRRQMQYIGKLMRDVDPAPIVAKLDVWKGVSQKHVGYMHQLERWRERLLESDDTLTELKATYPETDIQRLRTLIRNALKEREAGKPAKNYREIFQVLKAAIPEPV